MKSKPISRFSISNKFKAIGEIVGVNLNTHLMRKTRGWSMHSYGGSLEMIAKILNHSSPSVKIRCLGITREEVLETYEL